MDEDEMAGRVFYLVVGLILAMVIGFYIIAW